MDNTNEQERISIHNSSTDLFDDNENEENEITEISSDNSNVFTCPYCQATEISLYKLEVHVATNHVDSDVFLEKFAVDVTDRPTTSTNGGNRIQYPCPLCDFSFSKEEYLGYHIQTHSEDTTFYGVSSVDPVLPNARSEDINEHKCPLCGILFRDTDLLTSHVEVHFSGENSNFENTPNKSSPITRKEANVSVLESSSIPQANVSQSNSKDGLSQDSKKRKSKTVYDKQSDKMLEQAVIRGELSISEWHEFKRKNGNKISQSDDGHSRVTGLVEKIQELFSTQQRPRQRVCLCSRTDHFSGSYGDKGWGCGYRNIQMMMSCLHNNSNFSQRLLSQTGDKEIPSILKIQGMIEDAWKKGFDQPGCFQLGGKLVNTRKWIGATEIVTLLSSLKIKCHLADFPQPSANDGTHPRLFEWVVNYFSDQRSFKPPLYLQHQGHSRTVIGFEQDKDVTKLLLFDPGTSFEVTQAISTKPLTWTQMRTFRRPLSAFKSSQYQIVAVMGLLTDSEYEGSKVIKSERVI